MMVALSGRHASAACLLLAVTVWVGVGIRLRVAKRGNETSRSDLARTTSGRAAAPEPEPGGAATAGTDSHDVDGKPAVSGTPGRQAGGMGGLAAGAEPRSVAAGADPPRVAPAPDGPPSSMVAQLRRLVGQARGQIGPEAERMAVQLLAADSPILRVAGAAILSEFDRLGDEALAKIAEDPDLSVPLDVLGWLNDTGRQSHSLALYRALERRGVSSSDLLDLVTSGELTAAGSRMALDLVHGDLGPDEAAGLYEQIGTNSAQEYSVRMKAVLLLRDTMEFVDYREQVNAMRDAAAPGEALWTEGMSRLATRLVGPVQVHEAPPALTPENVDMMLAREYPTMLEDLALYVEYLANREGMYVGSGAADRLDARIREIEDSPRSEEEQHSLVRLRSLVGYLRSVESTNPPPARASPPPPHTGD